MNKSVIIVVLMALSIGVQAQESPTPTAETKTTSATLAYEAGAEVVSAFLWRGIYNGGLSFQPTASIGCDHEHVQFRLNVWGNVGASDWKFQTGLDKVDGYNPNTYFIPEFDLSATLRSHGVTVGFTHYYYGQGNYFNFGGIEKAMENSSQTEVNIGIDGDDWLPEEHHAYINWYTMVSGADANDDTIRAYSSYLELGYDYTFASIDLTIGAQLGIVPWRSENVYDTDGAALQCAALKINKAWTLDIVEIDLFAQGMICPNDIHKDNVYINAAGDKKLYQQKLNDTIGVGVWF